MVNRREGDSSRGDSGRHLRGRLMGLAVVVALAPTLAGWAAASRTDRGLPPAGRPPAPYSWRTPGLLDADDLAAGTILVAGRELRDPNFAKTVVLVVHFDDQGAMGLILNSPTRLGIASVFPEIEGVGGFDDALFFGGPVSRTGVSILVGSREAPAGTRSVLADVHLTSSRALLERLIEDPRPAERFRVFAGHAGWAAGQLEVEIARGGWHIMSVDAETVFTDSPRDLWRDLIGRTELQLAAAVVGETGDR